MRRDTPKWTTRLVIPLQLSLLHASIPLARIAAPSRWSKIIHISSGIAAALLTALHPKHRNIAEKVVLQGVLQGLALGLFNNTALYMALSMRYDHVTCVLASLGASIGGAVTPPVLATAEDTTAVERGFALWLLIFNASSIYALRKLGTKVPPAALKLRVPLKRLQTGPFHWPQLCCLTALCFAQLAL